MTRNRLMIGAAASAAALSLAAIAVAPAANATDRMYEEKSGNSVLPAGCQIQDLYDASSLFAVSYEMNKAGIRLYPTGLNGCNGVQLSLVSYSAPDYSGEGESLKQQKLVEAKTLNVDTAQDHQDFIVNLPTEGCYQLDFIVGEKYNDFKNGETYASERLIDHLNKCVGDEPYDYVEDKPGQGDSGDMLGGSPVDNGGNAGVTPGAGNGGTTPVAMVTPAPKTPATLPETGAGLGATGLAGLGAVASGLGVAFKSRLRRA